MKPQPRASFESPVRQFEDRVLGLALSLVPDRARAELIVEQAFARVLTGGNQDALEVRLAAVTHKLARSRVRGAALQLLPQSDERVSKDLHLRILDAVEDRQYTSQPVRSRLLALGAALLVVVAAGMVQLQRTRSEALAAAAPTIADLTPAPGAAEVAVDGQFRVQFARRPTGTPTLSHLPADGSQHLASWDGTTLLIDYTGLRFGVRYQVIVDAIYQSKLRETGHFQTQWTFVSEGPARLVATTPSDGTSMVPRNGQLAIELSRRPELEPTVSIVPADATLQPGRWGSSTWLVDYSGLRPLQRYQVSITLAAGHGAAAIHREWAFTTEPGAPPAGVPVIWYSTTSPWQGPTQAGNYRLVAIDWSGNIVGTMYPGQPVHQAPDGSRLTGQDNTFMDAGGRVLGVQTLSYGNIVWAEDSRHYCIVSDGGSPQVSGQWLEVGLPGAQPHRLAPLGNSGGRFGFSVLACNLANDRALVADQGTQGNLSFRVLTLSTGRLIYRRDYTDAQAVSVVGSPDGRYFAESSTNGATNTLIKRVGDGATLGRLGSDRVVAFSADGNRVITSPAWTSAAREAQLVDWRTAKPVWSAALSDNLQIFTLPRPGGSDLVIGIGRPFGSGDVDGIWLVHSDGSASKLVDEPVFLAGYPN